MGAIIAGLNWLSTQAQLPPDEVLKILAATIAGITIAWGLMKCKAGGE